MDAEWPSFQDMKAEETSEEGEVLEVDVGSTPLGPMQSVKSVKSVQSEMTDMDRSESIASCYVDPEVVRAVKARKAL